MNFDNYYDIILDLKSLSNLKEGFPIIYSKQLIEEYKDVCLITAIGNSNKGKTYILSKLTKVKNRNEKIKRIINNINDRNMTEDFIQHFALDSAHIVIVVVGELTFHEQNFLNKIKGYYRKKNKNLYVIHNLMFFERIEEVEYYMKNIIEKSLFFNIRKMKILNINKDNEFMNDCYYVEEMYKENYIIHLIMGKEGSEAGNYYNQSTIQFIRQNIISALLKLKKFYVVQSFSKYLCLYANEYFDLPLFMLEEKEKMGDFPLIEKENIEIDDNNIYKVNVPYDLKLKKNDIDNIFEDISKSNIPSLPYSYYKKGDKFIIQIEYCGKLEEFKIKKNILNGQYKFEIVGRTQKNPIKCLYSNINRGEFIICFSVGLYFMTIKSNEYQYENDEKNGIFNIIYEICRENKEDSDSGEDLGGDDDWW